MLSMTLHCGPCVHCDLVVQVDCSTKMNFIVNYKPLTLSTKFLPANGFLEKAC
jgi:hypothetical protein